MDEACNPYALKGGTALQFQNRTEPAVCRPTSTSTPRLGRTTAVVRQRAARLCRAQVEIDGSERRGAEDGLFWYGGRWTARIENELTSLGDRIKNELQDKIGQLRGDMRREDAETRRRRAARERHALTVSGWRSDGP